MNPRSAEYQRAVSNGPHERIASTCTAIALFCSLFVLTSGGHAQEQPPITPSGLNTNVSAPIVTGSYPTLTTQYNITGGTRPGGLNGTNLFHSFGDLNVPSNNIANFLNSGSIDPATGLTLPSGLQTTNILGRVTLENPSIIYGMIQTNGAGGFPNAHLFLMNPAGFLFGPNATINVSGMVAFTTADYLRLEGTDGNGIFYADAAKTSVLTSASVAAFGFLGSNPAAIAVQGSTLTVAQAQTISLVGGNQGFMYTDPDTGNTASAPASGGGTVTGGQLLAPGGQINLVSVASPGEILVANMQSAPNINGQSFTAMGKINLSEGALLDVSANAAGTVRIRGGQLTIVDATLSADTGNTKGASLAIDINITGNLAISDTRGAPAITTQTTGVGDAGEGREVRIASANLQATTTSPEPLFVLIDTHTSGAGRAGDVNITTGNLSVSGLNSNAFNFIDSGTAGSGHGGDVTVTADSVQLNTTTISTGDLVARNLLPDTSGVSGSAGNLTITADHLQVNFSLLNTDTFAGFAETQHGGSITLHAGDINITRSEIGSLAIAGGGAFNITADSLVADSTFFQSTTVSGAGGGITVNARTVELTNGSSLISTTAGDGNAGDIHVTATDHVSLLGHTPADPQNEGIFRPSGLLSNSTGDLGSGNAGNIIVTTPTLTMANGGRINTSTASSGNGGDVTINGAKAISISGEFSSADVEPIFGIGPVHPSGIVTMSVGGACLGPCGNAGNISIATGSLTLGNGGQINSGTRTTGHGGDVIVSATNAISLSGTLSDGSPVGVFSRSIGTDPGSGAGGNISLTAGQSVSVTNGASISSSSTGPGNAGNISINAGQQFDMRDSSITTQATKASGGNIDIQAIDLVRLVNSPISTSVQSGAGSGGNISIDPNVIVLQNSDITAKAVQGAGGNITLTTPLFLRDSSSQVDASSQFGVNGTVTIQSPTSNVSGSLGPLASKPSQAQALLTQRCAALVNGQASSFVVAGREQLPVDPGGWLSSPFVFTALGEDLDSGHAVAAAPAVMAMGTDDTGTVSLRRLTPAGFLMANFAESEASGCHS